MDDKITVMWHTSNLNIVTNVAKKVQLMFCPSMFYFLMHQENKNKTKSFYFTIHLLYLFFFFVSVRLAFASLQTFRHKVIFILFCNIIFLPLNYINQDRKKIYMHSHLIFSIRTSKAIILRMMCFHITCILFQFWMKSDNVWNILIWY